MARNHPKALRSSQDGYDRIIARIGTHQLGSGKSQGQKLWLRPAAIRPRRSGEGSSAASSPASSLALSSSLMVEKTLSSDIWHWRTKRHRGDGSST